MCKFILDEIAITDEIGLYAFNEILYEAFPIQKKGQYRYFNIIKLKRLT